MKTEMPRTGIVTIHLTLAMLLCSWLLATEVLISVSLIVKLLVVVALVAAAAGLTHLRVNDLKEYLAEEVQEAQNGASLTYAQFKRVIQMHSTLRYMFSQLHPQYSRAAISEHLYSQWLWNAITKGNILQWLSSYVESAGTRLVNLTWEVSHFPTHEQDRIQKILFHNVLVFRGHLSERIEAFTADTPRFGTPTVVPQQRTHTSHKPASTRANERVLV
jgi:hypothetical protein